MLNFSGFILIYLYSVKADTHTQICFLSNMGRVAASLAICSLVLIVQPVLCDAACLDSEALLNFVSDTDAAGMYDLTIRHAGLAGRVNLWFLHVLVMTL